MTIEPKAMKEIHDIRLSIFEEINDMTPRERTVYFSESAREAVEKYGIEIAAPADIKRQRTILRPANS